MDGERSVTEEAAETGSPSSPERHAAPARRAEGVAGDRVWERLGLAVPNDWWPSSAVLKSFEAAGFALTQVTSPPASVLQDARLLSRHARYALQGLDGTELRAVIHAPRGLLAGTPASDRALEGLLAYAIETGAEQVVYHGHALPDEPWSQDVLLAETRSLARLASRAERLGITIAVENLAPVYPGPERLSHTPMTLRSLVNRIGSARLGLCLDLGDANIVADLKHTTLEHLVRPVLDTVVLFHVHDNLGGRWDRSVPAGLDPLRLDLHLPPGRGTLPWGDIAPLLGSHPAPLLLEVHPPHRPPTHELHRSTLELLTPSLALA